LKIAAFVIGTRYLPEISSLIPRIRRAEPNEDSEALETTFEAIRLHTKADDSGNSTMRSPYLVAACLWLIGATCIAETNISAPLSSHQILPNNFKPSQVFKNVNLLRNINLEKGYVRETINVAIENTDAKEQDTYFIPFKAETIGKVGGLEVRDKKNPGLPAFTSEVVEYDPYR